MYWAKSYHHDWRDLRSLDVHKTQDGGYIVVGGVDKALMHQLGNRMFLPGQYLVMKLDGNGNVSWQKVWPDPPFWLCYAVCVQETDDGGFVIAGNRIVENGGGFEIPLVKFSAAGALVWQKVLSHANYMPWIFAMTPAPEDHIVLAGLVRPLTKEIGPDQDIWLVSIDASSGAIVWQKAYDFGSNELATALIPNREDGFVVAGNIEGPVTYPQPQPSPVFTLEVDGSGNLQAQKCFFLPDGIADVSSITLTEKGTFVLAGSFSLKSNASSVLAISFPFHSRKFYDWAWRYEIYYQGPKRLAYGNAVCETADREIAIAGSSTTGIFWYPSMSPFGGANWSYLKHALLLKLEGDGAPLWCRLYGGPDIDQFYSAEAFGSLPNQPGVLVGGFNESFPPFTTPPGVAGERIWVMKLDLAGDTSYNMNCMLHWAAVENEHVIIKDPKLEAKERKVAIKEEDIKLLDADIRTKEYFLCP